MIFNINVYAGGVADTAIRNLQEFYPPFCILVLILNITDVTSTIATNLLSLNITKFLQVCDSSLHHSAYIHT